MTSRFTVCSSLLAGLASVAMAQDMHVFSNGTVADAEKINDNFAAIDQEGPTITFSEPVMEADGLSGNVTVTISDPSGLFGYGAGSCYPCSSTSSWSAGDQQLLFNGETSVQFGIDVFTALNEVSSLVYYATDLRGNKSVKKTDYQGPTSAIKGGLYKAREPIEAWQPNLCAGFSPAPPDVPLRYVKVGIGVPQGFVYPELAVGGVTFCENAFEGTIMHGSCYDYDLSPAWDGDGYSVTPDDTSVDLTATSEDGVISASLDFSSAPSVMTLTLEEACDGGGGQGPFTITTDLLLP